MKFECLAEGCDYEVKNVPKEIKVKKGPYTDNNEYGRYGGKYELQKIEYPPNDYRILKELNEEFLIYHEFKIYYCNAGDDYEADYPGHSHVINYYYHELLSDVHYTGINGITY